VLNTADGVPQAQRLLLNHRSHVGSHITCEIGGVKVGLQQLSTVRISNQDYLASTSCYCLFNHVLHGGTVDDRQ
jgi:hypothetical protein